MNADALNNLVAMWAREDARREAGYCAPAAVLAGRLLGTELPVLLSALQGVRSDVWTEREAGRFRVGFRDNRAPTEYNALLSHAARKARALGWIAQVQKPRGGSMLATLAVQRPDIVETAARLHPLYVAALTTERELLARRRADAA